MGEMVAQEARLLADHQYGDAGLSQKQDAAGNQPGDTDKPGSNGDQLEGGGEGTLSSLSQGSTQQRGERCAGERSE